MIRTAEMEGPEHRRLLLVGGILGLQEDGPQVQALLEREPFDPVLLGIPFEDLDAIKATQGTERSHEFARDETEDAYLTQLGRYGTVQVPPPDLYVAHSYAEANKAKVEAVDLGDEGHTAVYTQHVGIFEVMRDNRRSKKRGAQDVPAKDAEAFAYAWDQHLFPSKGLRRVQLEREKWMATRIQQLVPPGARAFALVPLARMSGVRRELLATPGWRDTGKPL